MPAGEPFSLSQSVVIDRAIAHAEGASEGGLLRYSVYVGPLTEDSHARAQVLHAAGANPSSLVLIAIDLAGRRLEIVTGEAAHHDLDDRSCALAALSMTAALSAGDHVGAIVDGLATLSEHARHPRVLHTDQP